MRTRWNASKLRSEIDNSSLAQHVSWLHSEDVTADELLARLRDIAHDLTSLLQLRSFVVHRLIEAGSSLRFTARAASLAVSSVHAIGSRPPLSEHELLEPGETFEHLYDDVVALREGSVDAYADVLVLPRIADGIDFLLFVRDAYVGAARGLGVPVRRVAEAAGLSAGGVVKVTARLRDEKA